MVCGVVGNWTICWEASSSLAWKRPACGYSIRAVGVVGSVELTEPTEAGGSIGRLRLLLGRGRHGLMGPIPKEDGICGPRRC